MFPQSELDNYKLQVELLQEKLQRSEISRQQLEHKLDKILQKRDEHDKMVRSKARQKYQQFLEEQQRRNERNKQLVQMLESIEQQTEAMNARSERLKMMKLQYEMYFAKLVHSQTRRCLQNSVNPMTHMMPTSSSQRIHPTTQQPFMEGYNYVTNIETPTSVIPNQYQRNVTSFNEKESFLGAQQENSPWNTTETTTLDNFVRMENNEYMDFRNLNVVPTTNAQQLYQPKYEAINNNIAMPINSAYNKQDIPDTSYQKVNNNNPYISSPATNLLPNNKPLSELKEKPNLSIATIEEITNESMIRPNMHNANEIPNTATVTANSSANFQTDTHINEIPLKFTSQKDQNSTSNLKNINQNINTNNALAQDGRKELQIRNPTIDKVNEFEARNGAIPKVQEKPLSSLNLEPINAVTESPTTSANDTNIVNKQPEPAEQIENTESNSSTAPVSIENIENEIYGELLSPLETAEVEKTENPKVAQELLENLVTQPENVEIKNVPSAEPIVKQDIVPVSNSFEDTTATGNKIEEQQVTSNQEQTLVYENYNNDQPPVEVANNYADYTDYQNVDNAVIDGSQQQQEYDYSNYDPTQYSYPGYIYDETTGEYKPDPNAPPEQYATDQQYSAEGYDQQYQQQDYDYNQTYTEIPAATTAAAESTEYNNYDTSQQVVSSNFTPSNTDAEQPQPLMDAEHTAVPSELTSDDVATPSNKVIKPTSILSTAEKNDSQKKKKRVNFIDSSETDESVAGEKIPTTKPAAGHLAGSSESDFDFSSSTEAEAKNT